jgi:hypothetical protein
MNIPTLKEKVPTENNFSILFDSSVSQGCKMVYFETKNPTYIIWINFEGLGMGNVSLF